MSTSKVARRLRGAQAAGASSVTPPVQRFLNEALSESRSGGPVLLMIPAPTIPAMAPTSIAGYPAVTPATRQIFLLLAVAVVLLLLLLVRPGPRRRLWAAFRGLVKLFFITGLIAAVVLSVLFLVRSVGVPGSVPGSGSSAGSSSGTGSTPGGGYSGTLSVSDDNGYLLVNGLYIGQGRAVVTLPAGQYTLYAVSPSTGKKCWETGIRIDAGRTTTVRYSSYCR